MSVITKIQVSHRGTQQIEDKKEQAFQQHQQ